MISLTYVGGSRQRQRLGTGLEAEDLTVDNPGERAPGGGEEEDVDADKGDGGLLRGQVVHDNLAGVVLARGQSSQHGDEELRDAHADGTPEKQGATSPAVDGPHTGKSRSDVDGRGDHTDNKTVGEARVLEVLRSVVEDEVDTSQLLERLESAAGELALEDGGLEAVEVATSADGGLVIVVGLDLGNLLGDVGVVLGKAADLGQGLGGAVDVALLDEETGRLGQEKHAEEEDERPGELDGDGDAVGSSILTGVRCVVNNGSQEQTDGDGPLVGADDGTTNPLGGGLGLVEGDYRRLA